MALKDAVADVVNSAKHLLSSDDGKPDEESQGEQENAKGPDAISLLKQDHREVEALFKTILDEKSSSLTAQKKNIAAVLAALTLHAKIEESIVYPAVYGKTKRDSGERLEVLEAYEEHGSMKDLMKKIARSQGRDESLKAKVQVLSEITEHHVKEEESTFFPEARKLLGEEKLLEIGRAIQKIKQRAERRSAPGRTRKKAARAATGRRKKK